MNRIAVLVRNRFLIPQAAFSVALLLMILTANSLAQNPKSATDGATPPGIAPGTPAGAFALSEFDSINPYNGNLNFSLPLLGISGRGGAGLTMRLTLDTKRWRVLKGETKKQLTFTADPDLHTGIRVGYGPGILIARHDGSGLFNATPPTGQNPGTCAYYMKTLTRLTFITSNGTEFDLRDSANKGEPLPFTGNPAPPCNAKGQSRGKVFTSADGTAATFVSDTEIFDEAVGPQQSYPSGSLMLRDGTRYRIDVGLVTRIRDRNGNRMDFTYDRESRVTSITDSLNRQVTITYGAQDVQPYGLCDQIRYQGFRGQERIIRVSKAALGETLAAGVSVRRYRDLFNDLPNGVYLQEFFNPEVVKAVWLPDSRSYKLSYNSYGELSRVELPTGGAVEYVIPQGSGVISQGSGPGADYQIYRRVIERRVYRESGALDGSKAFNAAYSGSLDPQPWTTTTTVDQFNGDGRLLARQKHYYTGSGSALLFKRKEEDFYSAWTEGQEYQTESFDADGVTLLTHVENKYQQRAPVSWWTGAAADEPANDPQLIRTITTFAQTNQSAKKKYQYDKYNNVTSTQEYDFNDALIRDARATYLTTNSVVSGSPNYATDTNIHIRNLPVKVEVVDGNGVVVSRTIYEYDNYSIALLSRGDITGLTNNSTASYWTRGNVTRVTQDVIPTGGQISTYREYDVAGNVVAITDPKSNRTSFDFTDNFGSPGDAPQSNTPPAELNGQMTYGFPTLVTNPLGHTAQTQYDYQTGKAVNLVDANGQVTNAFYDDVLDRPTRVIEAGIRQTSFIYNDPARTVTTAGDQISFGDGKRRTEAVYDGLGRVIETRQYEGTGYIAKETGYDGLGRLAQTTNPYRPGEGVLWTTTEYDGLSRVIAVTTPDGAKIKTDYFGPQTRGADQAGKTRRSRTDSLGRLVEVIEDPFGLAYQTTYAYDALDNLTQVVQGGQTRSFSYDSLKRLTSAKNPESGAVKYAYDANSNLTSKKDARSVSTSYQYDALNRLTITSYNDGTPQVIRAYDAPAIANSRGRLISVSSPVSSSYFDEYDALGRVKRRRQVTDGQTYAMSYEYDPAGNPTKQTYPSGRVITTSYDDLSRVTSVSGQKSGEAGKTYASSFTYTAHSGLKSVMLGNGLWERVNYNLRLQAEEIGLGNSSLDSSVVKLGYSYGGTNNNGNVLSQTITAPGLNLTQTYSYDGLNRLSQASEAAGTTEQWRQTYDYDRYGNRAVRPGSLVPAPALTPQSLSTFSSTTNQITLPGFAYDASGNLVSDPATGNGAGAIIYDAENRMTGVTKNGTTTTYAYDGEGRRVKKAVGGIVTVYAYNIIGQLIAEYDGAAGQAGAVATSYLTTDHLGSARVVTDGSGMVKARYDYLPFGEEIFSSIGGRAAVAGYNANSRVRQRFTGKERDAETGLDYFGARYYGSAVGRFMTPDWSAKPVPIPYADLTDPQSFNQYAYVRNNPLSRNDPDGHRVELINTTDKDRKATEQRILKNLTPQERKLFKIGVNQQTHKTELQLKPNANVGGQHSSAFNRLVTMVNDQQHVASVKLQSNYTDPQTGQVKSVGHDAGGGITFSGGNLGQGNSLILLAPEGNTSDPQHPGTLPGLHGGLVEDKSHTVAAHELMGHGFEVMTTGHTQQNTVVQWENQMRQEQGLGGRQP